MKMTFLITLVGLAIGFAVPAFAQQKDTVDPELRQQIEAILMKFDDAFNKNDLTCYNKAIHAGRGSYDELVHRRYVCWSARNRENV